MPLFTTTPKRINNPICLVHFHNECLIYCLVSNQDIYMPNFHTNRETCEFICNDLHIYSNLQYHIKYIRNIIRNENKE